MTPETDRRFLLNPRGRLHPNLSQDKMQATAATTRMNATDSRTRTISISVAAAATATKGIDEVCMDRFLALQIKASSLCRGLSWPMYTRFVTLC